MLKHKIMIRKAFMDIFITAIIILSTVILLALAVALVCYLLVFYISPRGRKNKKEEYEIPQGPIYEPFRDAMISWIKEGRALPHREISITSFDGLRLYGRYYHFFDGAPIELILHGYRGSAERDLSGAISRCRQVGTNVIIVDQRCGGKSEGRTSTFGIRESRDCRAWIDYIITEIDPNAKIIIGGVSMGASTVMICAGEELPANVVGILADCGYTSAKAIIKKVMRDIKVPPALLYPFVRLGAIIFGGFDPEATSPVEQLKKSRLPIIFFHGEDDAFVPCDMSRENFKACASEKKKLVTIKGAGHGLAFPVDPEKYVGAVREFFGKA